LHVIKPHTRKLVRRSPLHGLRYQILKFLDCAGPPSGMPNNRPPSTIRRDDERNCPRRGCITGQSGANRSKSAATSLTSSTSQTPERKTIRGVCRSLSMRSFLLVSRVGLSSSSILDSIPPIRPRVDLCSLVDAPGSSDFRSCGFLSNFPEARQRVSRAA